MVDRLAELAQGGAALEVAVGTGRVALALSARGVRCTGSSSRPTWFGSSGPSRAPGRGGEHRRHDVLTEGGQETELMYRHGHELAEFRDVPTARRPARPSRI